MLNRKGTRQPHATNCSSESRLTRTIKSTFATRNPAAGPTCGKLE
jgi:hypothetical protein